MSYKFHAHVASRYLWSSRSDAFIKIITIISVLGVAIGVMVIDMTMSIMSGFEHELREKILGADAHIVVRSLSGQIKQWPEIKEEILKNVKIESISPFTYHQVLLRSESGSSGLLLKGIAPGSQAETQVRGYVKNLKASEPLFTYDLEKKSENNSALPGIVVGAELARTLGLNKDQAITLISPQVSSTPMGLVPKFKRFLLTHTYNSGLVSYESGLAYIDMAQAQAFFRMADSVNGLEIRLTNDQVDKSAKIAADLNENMTKYGEALYAQDWTSSNQALWDALRLEKKVYFIVLLLIIVMASFSIISTLILLVMEKRGDIAILRTLGATSGDVAKIFRFQGIAIGLLGTVFGSILGIIGCVALREYGFPLDERIFQMSTVPVRMDLYNFVAVALSAFSICFIATLYPARRASRLNPAEVLRHE